MVDDADDVAEGFGVPRMVNHFVDVFRPRPCLRPCRCPPARRHRLGHLLDTRLTDRTAERVYSQGLRCAFATLPFSVAINKVSRK